MFLHFLRLNHWKEVLDDDPIEGAGEVGENEERERRERERETFNLCLKGILVNRACTFECIITL